MGAPSPGNCTRPLDIEPWAAVLTGMTDTWTVQPPSRRQLLRFLATTAGIGFVGSRGFNELFAQTGARRISFPKGAVIRTILKDVAPDTIGGPTLFHEHMSLSRAYWDQMVASFPPAVKERLAVPASESYFLENMDLIVSEMRAAKQDGIACLVDGGHADMGRSVAFLKEVSTRSGLPIVVSGGYYTQPFQR